MKRVHLASIGCKLNAHEAELLASQLRDAGYTVVKQGEAADVVIVNSCTVTVRSDQRTRNLARTLKRDNPGAVVIVTGCSAQAAAASLETIDEVDYIRGNLEKGSIPELVEELAAGGSPPRVLVGDVSLPGPLSIPILREFRSLTRPFVKIQDGCDNRCSYCAIPAARGPQRSNPPDRVEEQVRIFTGAGFTELVLSGIHLGAYGSDLTPPTTLVELLGRLLDDPACPRLRLSSIEPLEFTPALVDVLVEEMGRGRICRHLHVPLQSGCDEVLGRMNRRYDTATYAALVTGLASRVPGLALGADVLVGLPGETAGQFDVTAAFVDGLPLAYLHVFSYSPRPGTPAAAWPDQVAPTEKKRRCHALREISTRHHEAFLAGLVGTDVTGVAVQRSRRRPGSWEILTDNYVRVAAPGDGLRRGELVTVRPTNVVGGRELDGLLIGP